MPDDTFTPLITALTKAGIAPPRYALDIENTGGGCMCLFIRTLPYSHPGTPDRCVVFSDLGWNEPDPTADSETFMGMYSDWNDEDDMGYLDEADSVFIADQLRYNADQVEAIAKWAAPYITDWLKGA